MFNLSGCDSLGEALILDVLSCARIALTKEFAYKSKRYKIGSEALAELESDSIHKIIDYFELNLDGDYIVNKFFYLVKQDNNNGNGREHRIKKRNYIPVNT